MSARVLSTMAFTRLARRRHLKFLKRLLDIIQKGVPLVAGDFQVLM